MKTSLGKLLCVLVLGLVICFPVWATAKNIYGYEDGAGYPFDTIEMFFTDPTALTSPTEKGFDHAGWTSQLINSQYSKASGPAVTPPDRLYFTLTMPDPSSICDYIVWNGGVGGTLVYTQHMTWNGTSFGITTFSGDGYHGYGTGESYNRTPIPASVLLLGSGLVGLALLGFRRRQS